MKHRALGAIVGALGVAAIVYRRRRCLRNPSCCYEEEARWLRIEADRPYGRLLVSTTERFKGQPGGAPARDQAEDKLLDVLNGEAMPWPHSSRTAGYDNKDQSARRARDKLAAEGVVAEGDDGRWRAA